MPGSTDAQPGPEAMRELRQRMLTTPAAEFGIEPTTEFPRVYGILMDWPIGEDIATVVSLCDGNASLYTTTTFGVIGGGAHEPVREQASRFVQSSTRFLDDASPTSDFPYPQLDQVKFYLLTFDGVRVLDADMPAIQEGRHRLTELFGHGQAVLTELRLITQRESGDDTQAGRPRQEWSGEAGYVNCLLTSMSSGSVRSIRITTSEGVPNLLELTAGDADAQNWIEAQGFPYESLDAGKVIGVLKQSARIGGLPFLTRRGELPTIHARDDGSAVARVFDISIGPFNRFATIDLAPDDDPRSIALQQEADSRHAK